MRKHRFIWYNPKTFSNVDVTKYVKVLFTIIISLLVGFMFFIFKAQNKIIKEVQKIPTETVIYLKQKDNKFSKTQLKKFLKELHIQHSDIVYAQAVIESGNFTSNMFRKNNNMFGMKVAKSRPTTAIVGDNSFAYYKTWKDCVIDYALYQAKYLSNLSKEQYLTYLSKYYAEDKGYVDKLKKYLRSE